MTWLIRPGARSVGLYYASKWAFSHNLTPLALVLYNLNLTIHGCDISYKADIGPGLKIYHPVGIVVGLARAGKNLTLGQNCTVGNRDQHTRDGRSFPVLGDDVTINAGAAVIGPITLGDGVKVGVNAVVFKDCQDYATMVGVPARAIKRTEDVSGQAVDGASRRVHSV